MKRTIKLLAFVGSLIFFVQLHAVFGDLARSCGMVNVKSISQTITDDGIIIFEGDVEALIDRHLHLWADRITINKKNQTLFAESLPDHSVVIEDENFLFLADSFTLNAAKKTGWAKNLRLHVDEGHFAARSAKKLDENRWELEDMTYTACDADIPHWRIQASKAIVHGSYFISASGILFKAGGIPIFGLPQFVFPIQGRSKSGFLIPRFAYDYDYGISIKLNYYKYISPHADTTVGVDWCDRKGTVFSDEFRWARSPECYTTFYGQYAILRDRFLQKQSRIVKATEHRYWITGKDFRRFHRTDSPYDINTLLRADFGTDKKIGYHFFNSTNDVDDTYNNSFITRMQTPSNLINFDLDMLETSRKYYSEFNNHTNHTFVVKETEDHADEILVPHVEWNTAFTKLGNYFYYRHDFFVDHLFSRQREYERWYVNSILTRQKESVPLIKSNLIRLLSRGHFSGAAHTAHNTLSAYVQPTFQLVSSTAFDHQPSGNVLDGRIFNHGAYRLFCEYGAEWALPEGVVYTTDNSYSYALQPLITWEYLPKFYQKNWYYVDHWDRAYPKNQVSCLLKNAWNIHDLQIGLDLIQGYDFYQRSDIFPLRRGVHAQHLLPFRYDLMLQHPKFSLDVGQDYEWKHPAMLQSDFNIGWSIGKINCNLGYLFQHRNLQRSHELLSRIPHFITTSMSVPLGHQFTLTYDGQFYATKRSTLFRLAGLAPLVHRLRLDYDGHCWGMYIGYEEKKYKEYGIGRDERAIVFAFRLESLGSFAKKFKRIPSTGNVP